MAGAPEWTAREHMTGETSEPLPPPAHCRVKPFPAYKDSGVEWLGEIPAHWRVSRLKHLALLNPESLPEETDPDLAIAYVDIGGVNSLGRIVAKESLTFSSAPSRARRLVREGDVIVSTVRTYLRAIAHISEPERGLVVSTGFAVVRPGAELTTNYAAYALRAPYFVERVVANSTGVSFPAISEREMATYGLAVPPPREQQAIAAFLDRETARIDGLVAKKERLIDLLQEKRASLITRAVTKGLDPSVPMKDSDVEWLGQIPASWSLARLKRLVTRVEQGWSPLCENRQADDHEWGVLKVGCVNGMEFDGMEHKALPSDLDPVEDLEIAPGDILMSRANTRQLLGSAALVQIVRPRLLLCDKLYRIRVRSKLVLPSFLVHAFSSSLSRFQFEREATGASASMQNISQQMILELLVPCPPPEEQQRIVEVVARDTAQLSGLLERIGSAVARLKELRTALISAAVMGKIDVRDPVDPESRLP